MDKSGKNVLQFRVQIFPTRFLITLFTSLATMLIYCKVKPLLQSYSF